MINVFIEKSSVEINEILISTNEKDWDTVAQIAHKMKPAIAYMGMGNIESRINDIIIWARSKENTDKIRIYSEFIKEVLNKVYELLRADLEEIKAEKTN